MEFLTCRETLGSCLVVSASAWLVLDAFGLALQNVGHVGPWVSSWCFDGVSVMFGHCICGLVSGFVVLWVVGVLCLGVVRVVLVVCQS